MDTTDKVGTNNIRERHKKRLEQRQRQMKRRRIVSLSCICAIVFCIILFFTPLFNIKSVRITGNNIVKTAQIEQTLGNITSKNLFRANKNEITKTLKTIPYINTVNIKKKLIPPHLEIEAVECVPSFYIKHSGLYIIADKSMKVLETKSFTKSRAAATEPKGVGELKGFTLNSVPNPGDLLPVDDEDKFKIAAYCLDILSDEGYISKITRFNFSDTASIEFVFENRLTVKCGSSTDFDKKIKMFDKAVHSSKLTDNSRGTIDLSISGKAIYTP